LHSKRRNLCIKVKIPLQLFTENPSQRYGASPAIWNYTMLPATRYRVRIKRDESINTSINNRDLNFPCCVSENLAE